MGFERMCRDRGIVSPNLLEQLVARNRLAACAVEKFQNIGFFFRQPDFPVGLVGQKFHAGLEFIRADLEDGVLALFEIAHMGTHARQQDREFERLGHIIIRA